MTLDESSYGALQIFKKDVHPSVLKSSFWNATKEGLSLLRESFTFRWK